MVCYKALPNRTEAQRRWVLSQAAAAGLDPRSSSWASLLAPGDEFWMAGRISPAPSFLTKVFDTTSKTTACAPAAVEIPATFRNKTFRDAFLTRILKGDPLPLSEIESWVEASLEGNEAEDAVGLLEQMVLNPKSPPHLAYALSLFYGRKGLAAQEYRALVQAQTQARRRPDLVFNLMLTNGRLALIASNQKLEDLLPAALTITTEPAGAAVTLNGEAMGNTPLDVTKLPPGDYRVNLRLLNFREANQVSIGRHYCEDRRRLLRWIYAFDAPLLSRVS